MFRYWVFALIIATGMNLPALSQDSDSKDKNLDIRSSVGDLHIGSDADAKKIGLPLYPGARPKSDDEEHNDRANMSLLTEAFGMKLIVASYVSDDAPEKVLHFYRDKLKKYGKVLECHSKNHEGDISVHDDDKDSGKSRELKCDENSGPVTDLKVGTEDNQRIVAVEPGESSKGSKFALVYVHTRGKSGEI
jgi:hypothetical protein